MQIDVYAFVAVIVFTLIAVTLDVKTRRIPNWLTVSATVLGLLYHIVTAGLSGVLIAIGGFATGFGFLLLLWLMGSGGGGDVKLMGAVGTWLGAFNTLIVFIGSAIFAVFCMVGIMAWHHTKNNKMKSADAASGVVAQTTVLKQTIPYAVPVAMSVWALWIVSIMIG